MLKYFSLKMSGKLLLQALKLGNLIFKYDCRYRYLAHSNWVGHLNYFMGIR